MNNVLLGIAMVAWIGAVATGSDFIKVKGEWKSVSVTWGLLAVGIVMFGIVLSK